MVNWRSEEKEEKEGKEKKEKRRKHCARTSLCLRLFAGSRTLHAQHWHPPPPLPPHLPALCHLCCALGSAPPAKYASLWIRANTGNSRTSHNSKAWQTAVTGVSVAAWSDKPVGMAETTREDLWCLSVSNLLFSNDYLPSHISLVIKAGKTIISAAYGDSRQQRMSHRYLKEKKREKKKGPNTGGQGALRAKRRTTHVCLLLHFAQLLAGCCAGAARVTSWHHQDGRRHHAPHCGNLETYRNSPTRTPARSLSKRRHSYNAWRRRDNRLWLC